MKANIFLQFFLLLFLMTSFLASGCNVIRKFIICCVFVLSFSQIHAQSIRKIDSSEAYELLQSFNYHSGVLIDGRNSTMFADGHIEKAILINAYEEDLSENLIPLLKKERIMVYCTTQNRTNTIVKTLIELNYKGEIIVVADGIKGWKKNNYPLKIPGRIEYQRTN